MQYKILNAQRCPNVTPILDLLFYEHFFYLTLSELIALQSLKYIFLIKSMLFNLQFENDNFKFKNEHFKLETLI